MKVGFEALTEIDRLTSKELVLLDDDEWVEVLRRRDFTRDASCETRAMIWVSDDDAIRQAEERGEEDADVRGGYRLDQGKLLTLQFEYMAQRWNVYAPEKDGERPAIPFTRENRAEFVKLHGAALYAQMLIRGGGIAPDVSGKADPDTGKSLTFPQEPGISTEGRVPGARAARSVRTA